MLRLAVATIEKGAVGNHTLAIQKALKDAGIDLPLYAETIRPEFQDRVRNFSQLSEDLKSDDTVFYQFANPSPIADLLYERDSKIILNYHCITPASYFMKYDPPTAAAISRARTQLARLAPISSASVAVSEFNASELVDLDCANIEVIPPAFSENFYNVGRNEFAKNNVGAKWLYVGRIAPHKCVHEIIQAFDFYKRNCDDKATLTIVGKADVVLYGKIVRELVAERKLTSSVTFIENAPLEELVNLYQTSSLFISLSEHEGFCVPLVEAMACGLPILAKRAAAVGSTVSSAGVLLDNGAPEYVSMAIEELKSNSVLVDKITERGFDRAEYFHPKNTLSRYVEYLSEWV